MALKPGDIIKKVKQAPSFQQNNVEASYSGQKVTWELAFNSIRQINGDVNWRVMSRNPGSYPWVYFNIDIDQYPQFKILHEEDLLEVTGIIERVVGHEINLKNVEKISFLGIDVKNSSQVNVNSNFPISTIHWPQTLFGQIFIGLVILIIGGGILYYLGWN